MFEWGKFEQLKNRRVLGNPSEDKRNEELGVPKRNIFFWKGCSLQESRCFVPCRFGGTFTITAILELFWRSVVFLRMTCLSAHIFFPSRFLRTLFKLKVMGKWNVIFRNCLYLSGVESV